MCTKKFKLINWINSVSARNFPKRLAAWALRSLFHLLRCLMSITVTVGSARSKKTEHRKVRKGRPRKLNGV